MSASKLKALATLARVKVEAAPADKLSAPAEVRAKIPEVVVERVKLAEVVPMVEAAKPVADMFPEVEVRLRAPAERVKPLLAVRVEEKLPVPVTSRVVPGAELPIPTLLLRESMDKVLASKLRALATLAKVNVEAAPADKLSAPAEVRAKVPEVAVDKVRFDEVVLIVELLSPVAEMIPEVALNVWLEPRVIPPLADSTPARLSAPVVATKSVPALPIFRITLFCISIDPEKVEVLVL